VRYTAGRTFVCRVEGDTDKRFQLLTAFLTQIYCRYSLLAIYRVAAIYPDHFQSLTVALKNHIFY
jgi:hypothetical protein